ncbi:MAG: hypothetical protein NC338_03270 [Firmicutes bacterium]|nr:hypothetical protein [Bacillota bacterium]MCM1401919.1 hypothetical protein [Bacteroides sp.]MCM1476659.1 hypothetical protein [Bacteroides sp.]
MSQKQLSGTDRHAGATKAKVSLGLIIFLLGVVAGVIGLCGAIKIIFYIGLTVAILAAVALVWGIIAVRNRFDEDVDSGTE